jgi:hypothetical protein
LGKQPMGGSGRCPHGACLGKLSKCSAVRSTAAAALRRRSTSCWCAVPHPKAAVRHTREPPLPPAKANGCEGQRPYPQPGSFRSCSAPGPQRPDAHWAWRRAAHAAPRCGPTARRTSPSTPGLGVCVGPTCSNGGRRDVPSRLKAGQTPPLTRTRGRSSRSSKVTISTDFSRSCAAVCCTLRTLARALCCAPRLSLPDRFPPLPLSLLDVLDPFPLALVAMVGCRVAQGGGGPQ